MEWFKRISRSKTEDPDWQILTANNEETGDQAVIRLRMNKPKLGNIAKFATAVEITWPFEGDSQMPSTEISQQQYMFEEAVDELSAQNGFAELVQVSTGMGVKEWLYYTCDQPRFMESFNQLLRSHEKYPLKIAFYEDPTWSLWTETLHALKDRK